MVFLAPRFGLRASLSEQFFIARASVSFHIDQAFVFAPGHSCINDTHMN